MAYFRALNSIREYLMIFFSHSSKPYVVTPSSEPSHML